MNSLQYFRSCLRDSLNSKLKVFLIFFVYLSSAAIFVQFIALPYIFPHVHSGDGLLKGLDSVAFHTDAIAFSKRIQKEGWQVWQLRPIGTNMNTKNASVGIASAVYAATTPKPWALIPVNASLHAGAGLFLFLMLLRICKNPKLAFIASSPFVVFPSSLTWVTQLQKDAFSIFGSMAVLYGLIVFAEAKKNRERMQALFLVWAGLFAVWIVRPYLADIIKITLFLFIGAIIGTYTYSLAKKRTHVKEAATIVMFALLLLAKPVHVVNLIEKGLSIAYVAVDTKPPGRFRKFVKSFNTALDTNFGGSATAPTRAPLPKKTAKKAVRKSDDTSNPFPLNIYYFITTKLEGLNWYAVHHLGTKRLGFQMDYPNAGTNLDGDVYFEDIGEIILFIPRTLQILFFAPFPTAWFEEAVTEGGSYMRKAAMLEMTIAYLCYIFLPYSLWVWRRSPQIWILVIYCTTLIMPMGLVVANIGTLYRMRYAGFMVIVCLGLLGAIKAYQRKKPHPQQAG